MKKRISMLLAVIMCLSFFLTAGTEAYGIDTKDLDTRRIEWAMAMTANMAGNALDREEEAESNRQRIILSQFTQIPYLSPDRAIVLEFTKDQAKSAVNALGITGFAWEDAAPTLAGMINQQFSRDYTHAADLARAEGSTTVEYSRYFTMILLSYGAHISVTSLTAYGTINSSSAFVISTEEISQSLGEEDIAQYIQKLGLEMPLVRIYTKQDLDTQIAADGWGTGSDSFRFMTDALLASEKRRETLLPAWVQSDSPYLTGEMKYGMVVTMLSSMEKADLTALRNMVATLFPQLSENREEAVAQLLQEGHTAGEKRITAPKIEYGEELHETGLKKDGTFLTIFERTEPEQETVSWFDPILEAALPPERIPETMESADYIIRFVVTYEGGVSNGDAHLHYPLTHILVHDAHTGEMLRDLGFNKRKLSGVVMLSKGDTWWNPLYTELWEYIRVLFEEP